MSEVVHERRRLLLSTAAWVGGLATVAVTRSARAFQVEEMPPTSAIGHAYAERLRRLCGARGAGHPATSAARQRSLGPVDVGDLPDLRLPSHCQQVAGRLHEARDRLA